MIPAIFEPQIVLCTIDNCGEHGHITLPNGAYSLEFCSVQGAYNILGSQHVRIALRNLFAIQKLRVAIKQLDLPANDFHAPMTVARDVRSWNIEYGEAIADRVVLPYAAHGHSERNPLVASA